MQLYSIVGFISKSQCVSSGKKYTKILDLHINNNGNFKIRLAN